MVTGGHDAGSARTQRGNVQVVSVTPARLALGVLAGLTGAAVWVGAEPLLRRVSGTPFSDTRLLAGLIERRSRSRGGAYWRRGLVAAEIESLALWPAMLVADRKHPDRRSGLWPPLARSPRVFGQEALAHGLFGAIVGALTPPPAPR
jgi:hypothetical protein